METKGTIIYICQFAGTKENGMNYRPYYLGKYLVKMGYRFIVFGSGYHHQMKSIKNLTKQTISEKIDGIEYFWMPSSKYKAKNYFDRIRSLFAFPYILYRFKIRKIVNQDTVLAVVSSSPNLLTSIPAIKWAKILKTKFIFEVRDIWPLSLTELSGVSEKNPFIMFLKYVERLSYKKAHAVFSVLSQSKDYMMGKGMADEKFVYIPNGIDQAAHTEAKNTLLPEQLTGKFIVGYAGTIGVANNISVLLKTAEILSQEQDIHFVIIGDGPVKSDMEKISEGINNVSFLPPVSKESIQSYLKKFSVGYLGLKKGKMFEYGISPNKLFDYMLAEIPVLLAVNTRGSIVEKAGCGIVVHPDDPQALADSILKLYRMTSSNRNIMGRNGYDFVLEYHRYENISKLFIQSVLK